jgi:hypothetical protein
MTTPREAVALALHKELCAAPGCSYMPADKGLAIAAIQALREGATERLRKRFPTIAATSLEGMVDAILGSPESTESAAETTR